jgi:hypothetical protein
VAHAGCDGAAQSVGDALRPLDPSAFALTLAASVGTCTAERYAHPNVCCLANADASTCGTYPMSPFAPCPAGFDLYPDPSSCCDLDDPTQCSDAMASNAGVASTCVTSCSPGYYEPAPGKCCAAGSAAGGASGACVPSANFPPAVCNGPVCLDGGACAAACNGCGGCPAGFVFPADGSATTCCSDDAGGGRECFSLALGAGAGVTTAGGVDAGLVDAAAFEAEPPRPFDASVTPG